MSQRSEAERLLQIELLRMQAEREARARAREELRLYIRQMERDRRYQGIPDRFLESESYNQTSSTSSAFVGEPGAIIEWNNSVRDFKPQYVIPKVKELPESGKPNDLVIWNEQAYICDGRSWMKIIKEEQKPAEEDTRKIILENADAVECDS